jgi:hypothetical protein
VEQVAVAAHIGRLAGGEHRRLAALAQTSQQSTAVGDFYRALAMVLAGVQSRSRSRQLLDRTTAPAVDS